MDVAATQTHSSENLRTDTTRSLRMSPLEPEVHRAMTALRHKIKSAPPSRATTEEAEGGESSETVETSNQFDVLSGMDTS